MENSSVVALNAISTKWKWLNFIDWLLPAYIIFSLPLFYLGSHLDFLFKGTAIMATVLYLIRYGYPRTPTVKIFIVFFLLVSFSFIQYIYNDRPFALYISDASNYIAAMLFFFVGASDDRPGRPFYEKLKYTIAIMFALGLFCFVTMPSWYLERMIESISLQSGIEYGENTVFEQMRFGAFWGDSYSVSHLSVFCSAIAMFDIAYTRDKQKLIAIICLVIGIASSIASMHRASMAGSAIALVCFFYFNHKTHHYKTNRYLIIFGIVVLIGFLVLSSNLTERFEQILSLLTSRVDDNMSLDKALKERKFTQQVMESMRFFFFGHGLGAGSVSARAYGFPGISDMQYVKMFFENGIVGAVLFLMIIFRVLRRGIKFINYYLTEVAIILFILVAMLGSNSLSIYYLIVYPFWYAVGRLSNNDIGFVSK